MTKTQKKLGVVSLVTFVILVAFIIVGIVNINFDWGGTSIGKGIGDTFNRIGNIFNFSLWNTFGARQVIASLLILFLVGVSLVTIVGVTLLSLKTKKYIALISIPFFVFAVFAMVAYLANFDAIHETLISNENETAITLFIFSILLILSIGALAASLLPYYFEDLYKYEEVNVKFENEHIEEEIIEDITITEGNTNQTIIINNYYAEEKQPESKVVVAPEVVANELVTSKKRTPRSPFALKLKNADQSIRDIYNELKAEFISYGLKSRISVAGDTFRLHTITYAQIQISGKNIKVYFALDPKELVDSTTPFSDVSNQKVFTDIPVAFKVSSGLAIRRAKELIERVCERNGIIQEELPEILDYSKEAIDTLNDSEYYLKNFNK